MLVENAQTLASEAALWTRVHELLGLDVIAHGLLLHSGWPGANLLLGHILHLLLSLLVHHVCHLMVSLESFDFVCLI